MGDKDDYLTSYRVFFEKFAATVDPKDQLPVNIAGYTITPGELPGEVLYWTAEYLSEIQCPPTLMTTLRRIVLDEVLSAAKKHPDEFGYDPNECEYEALRLMQAVTSKVNDVCLRYLDNSRLDTLPPPPPAPLRGHRSASAAVKNLRRVMEDRHVEISNLEALFGIESEEATGFFAVYDGHAGAAAATYCAAHLHQYLVESPRYTTDLRQALYDAFVKTDLEFVRKSHQKRACGGSTAVVVCVRGRQLVTAWAGDSLALLAKRMGLLQLVNPHKPNRPDETIRIHSSGGVVLFQGTWRVNGQLAVSRAIGNAQYKPYVTAQPEIEVVDLDGDEDFVVVACDGLWDVVTEDAVAYSVYEQLMHNPDDVKAVTNKLVRQAKEHKSQDNITVIVVFLKDPRNIVADNRPPMDLGLENAVVNPPPFAVENEACKVVHGGGCLEADNGVSDSDSDDLGPETAVDQDLDLEENHETAPTPPANTVDSSHVDGNLVDNVAESGEESEDEWNYYKGEGEREHNPSEEAEEAPRSETPCQENSTCESSSVDMNSSPLNPDAPVFVPGGVAGSDVLLAESPRKPLPMDDIELIDEAQFQTEAVIRPAELQDLDTSELNGHHNISMEGVTQHANGIDKSEVESLEFGFNVGIEEKLKEASFTHDFERIQKDTTDFCNIQVFQSHTETNPFSDHGDDELFERLKNKERDPMSMSFYQEKDDDTCERFGKIESNVDLNAVQPLPESDDEDIQQNGICIIKNEEDKENLCPEEKSDLFSLNENLDEPNNDILKFDDRSDNLTNNVSNLTNFVDFTVHNANNMQSYNTEFDSINQEETITQTDTPESHKLLFEQIPEIPDGKSSELGFTNEDLQDPSEGESNIRAITPQDEEISQDLEMEIKLDEHNIEQADDTSVEVPEIRLETEDDSDALENPKSQSETHSPSPVPSESPLPHESSTFPAGSPLPQDPLIPQETLPRESPMPQESSLLRESPLPSESPMPQESSLLRESPLPSESPMPQESSLLRESPLPSESPLPQESFLLRDSPLPHESSVPRESSLPRESPLANEYDLKRKSPLPQDSLPRESPLPQEILHSESPLLQESTQCEFIAVGNETPNPVEPPVHNDIAEPVSSPLVMSPVPSELKTSPLPAVSLQTIENVEPVQSLFEFEDLQIKQESLAPTEPSLPPQLPIESQSPAEVPLPRESPLPSDSPLPMEREEPIENSISDREVTQNKELPNVSIEQSENIVESQVTSDIYESKETSTITSDIENLSLLATDNSQVVLIQSPLLVEQIDQTVEALLISNETNPEELSEERVPSPEPIADLHPSEVSLTQEKPPPNESPASLDIETTQTDILSQSSGFLRVESSTQHGIVESIESKNFASESSQPIESAPAPEEPVAESEHCRLTPEMAQEAFALEAPEHAAPPDLLPHLPPHERNELVTDIDIGIPESRAQEICIPVAGEIQLEDVVRPPGTTPPPTPAVEPARQPCLDAPVAAAAAAVAVATAAAVAASKVVSKKSPTTPTPKSESRTPKAASKTTSAARTPASATKKLAPSPSAGAPRSPAPRTPASAAKASPAPRPSPRPAPVAKPSSKHTAPAAARSSASGAPASARSAAPVAARSAPVARSAPASRAAPKAPATKSAAPAAPKTVAAKPASTTRSAPAPRAAPASAPAAKPKESKPKAAAPKPLTNGDVKPISRPAPRPAAPPPRAAPRAAPRPAAPAPPAPAPLKSAPARPAARAALDKQSKDLANKRMTAKTAPPRTATTKASTGVKSVPRPGKKSADNKDSPNGAPPLKAPPSPPPPADALLPDVIA